MLVDFHALNAIDVDTWLTGDLNGPSPVWIDRPLSSGTWAASGDPSTSFWSADGRQNTNLGTGALNTLVVDGVDTASWLTGDVNGPSLTWLH